MISKRNQPVFLMFACMTLLAAVAEAQQTDASQPQDSQTPPSASTPSVAPMTADQLDTLVAPIALYPDALVAQVLAASENPDQVAYADDWLAQNKSLSGTALAQGCKPAILGPQRASSDAVPIRAG